MFQPAKKNVRFADLCYDESPDQNGQMEMEDDKLFIKRNGNTQLTGFPQYLFSENFGISLLLLRTIINPIINNKSVKDMLNISLVSSAVLWLSTAVSRV